MGILFLQLPKYFQCNYSCLWLSFVIGLSISWISRMPFYMVIYSRKSTWRNLLVLLLKGDLCSKAWFKRFSIVIQQFDMTRSKTNHFVFYRHSPSSWIYMFVCGDDIVITSIDHLGIICLGNKGSSVINRIIIS